MEVDRAAVLCREPFKFEDLKKFEISPRRFRQQYSGIYNARLRAFKDRLLRNAAIKWASSKVITLSELSERDETDDCVVIGTLYKHQELKPSILQEFSEELQLVAQPSRRNYASFKDVLYLEDETLRVKLISNCINVQDVVTGIVCAVLGRELENGAFEVVDWCLPGCCPKSTPHHSMESTGKILIVSGLDLINALNPQLLGLSLLSEWITGLVGSEETQKEVASIVCIIIAGNSIRGSVETHDHKNYFKTKARDEVIFREAGNAAHKLDNFLDPILQCCPVILMPGEFDPSCHALPQHSFHPCILPQSSRYKSFHGVTNPWIGSIESRIVAGSSGQPIMDIMKVAGLADVSPLTWLERTLLWQHYAPTAPDTVPVYTYSQTDPFIVTEYPDVYFVGNMDKYDTKLLTVNEGQTVRLICIPKFSSTQTGVLVDLQDLRTWPVSFS